MPVHTDDTIEILQGLTTELGRLLRQYKSKVCSHFHTEETPEEHGRRMRRMAKKEDRGEQVVLGIDNRRSRTVKKEYSDKTYKLHALGHYINIIIRFGALPSLSYLMVLFHYFFHLT